MQVLIVIGVIFIWLCSSVFSFVSYLVTHKLRKTNPFYYDSLSEILLFSVLIGPVIGIVTWFNYIIDKTGIRDKLNDWCQK